MKLESILLVGLFFSVATNAQGTPPPAPADMTYFGEGACVAELNGNHDWAAARDIYTVGACDTLCRNNDINRGLRGFVWDAEFDHCICYFEDGLSPAEGATCPAVFNRGLEPGNCYILNQGSGPVAAFSPHDEAYCYGYDAFPGSEGSGDPHCE